MILRRALASQKMDETTGLPYEATIGALELNCLEREYYYSDERRTMGVSTVRVIPFVQAWAPFSNFVSLEEAFDIVCNSRKISPVLHPRVGTVRVTSAMANVRDRASFKGSKVVAELPKGTVLPTTGRVSDYFQVRLQGGLHYLSRKSSEFVE